MSYCHAYLCIDVFILYQNSTQNWPKLGKVGNWKKGKELKYQLPTTNNLEDIEINFVDMPNAVQSEIYVGNLMDISMTNPDYFALKLGNQILGGSSTARLFMNLRFTSE